MINHCLSSISICGLRWATSKFKEVSEVIRMRCNNSQEGIERLKIESIQTLNDPLSYIYHFCLFNGFDFDSIRLVSFVFRFFCSIYDCVKRKS